ncbi:ABC transporter permease [Actinomadura litoris]|uniref:ABC transporter permease n=1 Tax=Actinomadura litoris TaxID=2678616 RepID=UPI001FA6E68A|nr:ABC transporter permease [Actinomadura litoris]
MTTDAHTDAHTDPHSDAPSAGLRAGGGTRGAVAAEWTKLWSVRSTWWGLAGSLLMMVLMCLIMGTATVGANTDPDGTDPPGVVSVSGLAAGAVDMVQFVVLTLAILVITGEYATGAVRATLQWVPVRTRMLLAKGAVVAAVVFPTGVVLALAGTATAYPALGEWGRLRAADLARDAPATGVYLALVSLMILGVGAMLRSTAATLTSAFLFLMVLPLTLANSGSKVLAHVADALPSSAGRHFLSPEDAPYPAAAGLAILTAWTLAALAGGITVLRRRDA